MSTAAAEMHFANESFNGVAAEIAAPPSFNAAALRAQVVRVANQEWARWNRGGRRTERDPRMAATLQDYWKSGAGVAVRRDQLASAEFQQAHPWSAAFISWVMRRAGAGRYFRYAASHAAYIVAARENRRSGRPNPFRAFRTTEVRPQVGDLACKRRAGSRATYDTVRVGDTTHCDVVTAVQPGRITLVGGNVDNSVSRRTLPLDADGFIRRPEYFAIIKIGALGGGGAPAPAPSPQPYPGPAPSPGPAPPAPVAGAPALVKSERSPALGSLYLNIDLQATNHDGSRVAPLTGVYLPPRFNPSGGVDVVLYLHGFKMRQPHMTIDQLWNRRIHKFFGLREATAASGRNVVLVAPTLGSRSNAGWLATAGGLDRYLALVNRALIQYAGTSPGAGIRTVTLACHSGGGRPMRQIAQAANAASPRVTECWGFDSLYNSGDDAFWANWGRTRPQSRAYFYYIPGSQTQRLARLLASRRAPNVAVLAAATAVHNAVPATHLAQRLAGHPHLRS